VLVELSGDADILSSHGSRSERLDGLDGLGGTLLEGPVLVGVLREMDGVVSGDEVRLGLAFLLGHFVLNILYELKMLVYGTSTDMDQLYKMNIPVSSLSIAGRFCISK